MIDPTLDTICSWSPIQLPLDLSADCVHVIRVRLDLLAKHCDELSKLLSDEERERAARFRFDEPRHRFIACRATLRQLLGSCCGIAPKAVILQYGKHGKPELWAGESSSETPQIEFNVSHSRDFGVIAIAAGFPVGIDVEECNPAVKTLKLAERFFAPTESKELETLDPGKQLAGFYRCWTSKEAYIKATGRGLSLSLSSFCVEVNPDQPATLKSVEGQPDASSQWTTKSLDVALNYATTVMAAKPNCKFQCWDWPTT